MHLSLPYIYENVIPQGGQSSKALVDRIFLIFKKKYQLSSSYRISLNCLHPVLVVPHPFEYLDNSIINFVIFCLLSR